VALILPALISSVRNEFPIFSPFLVARSLGFTGGTWDKLKAIPGFTFPDPGPQAIKALKQCGIAMSVTKEKLCPADRKMYQFRSMTGTIESPELIIASIASKQLALPADHLLMDVRYGEGAFLPTYVEAEKLAISLSNFIYEGGVPCSYHLTNSSEPNGMAIGNAYEVLEAIAVMNREFESTWDLRAIKEQKELVITFVEILMSNAFPEENIDWKRLANKQFDEGKVFQSFLNILEAHQVSKDVLRKLQTNPKDVLGVKTKQIVIRSRRAGMLKKIDQKKLGGLINFELGGGGNDYAGVFTPHAGLILGKRIGDRINYQDMLCSLFIPIDSDLDLPSTMNKIDSCFILDEVTNVDRMRLKK
jgi:thymidine phosphorylase